MKRRKPHQKTLFYLTGGLDFAALLCSAAGAAALARFLFPITGSPAGLALFSAAALLSFCTVFYLFYKPSDPKPRLQAKQAARILFCNAVRSVCMFILLRPFESELPGLNSFLLLLYIANSLLDCLFTFAVRRRLFYALKKSRYARRTAVLTQWQTAAAVIGELEDSVWNDVCALFLPKSEKAKLPPPARTFPVCGTEDDLAGWVRTRAVDSVYIVLPPGSLPRDKADALTQELLSMGVQVHISKHATSGRAGQAHSVSTHFGHKMAAYAAVQHRPAHLRLKRALDIVFGLLGCLAAAPIIALAAVPLKLESRGPLIFAQTRVGKNGRTFQIYKLRTMYADAEERKAELAAQNEMQGPMFKMKNDPRITKVGRFLRKTSIDELPQFWNVLKGDMSLVGTRPPTLDEFRQYESRHKRRLSMPAGLTGLWQTSGRSDITDFEEVVRLDLQYIDNWSVALDLKLMLKTAAVLLARRGAR